MSTPFSPSLPPFQLLFFDHDGEMARSRKLLTIVPDGQNDWRPDPKSMTLARLANHLTDLLTFATQICTAKELDFTSGVWKPGTAVTTADRLAEFDANAAELRASMTALDWPAMSETWVLRMGDQVLMSDARVVHLRLIHSHLTHHRAQLGVYLRLLGIPIPGSYGPSADEM
jgi:uncharacterized damage-inducible protein DinB